MADIYTITATKIEYLANGGPMCIAIYSTNGSIQAAKSGDIIIVGNIHGVALTDYNTATGAITVQIEGAFQVPVTAVSGEGNSAVAFGDPIFYSVLQSRLEKTPDDNGLFFGNALGTLTGGTTGAVPVHIIQSVPYLQSS